MATPAQIPIREVLIVIFLAGLFGGITFNVARKVQPMSAAGASAPGNPIASDPGEHFWTDIFKGLLAAFCVPIFLSFAQSDIFSKPVDGAGYNINLLLLGGYCLIAAYSSDRFIKTVSSRWIETVNEKIEGLKDTTNRLADDMADKNERRHPGGTGLVRETVPIPAAAAGEPNYPSDPDGRVLQALKDPDYPRGKRTLSGIVNDSELEESVVLAILQDLLERKVVIKVPSKYNGIDYYKLK